MGTYFLEPGDYQALVLAAARLEQLDVDHKYETIGMEAKKVARTVNKFIKTFERPPLSKGQAASYRVGRNFIRLGDTVKVKPSKPRKRDGFIGTVTRIELADDPTAPPKAVHVVGQEKGASFRALRPERIQRMAQKKS